MRSSHVRTATVLVALLAVIAAACGGSSSSDTTSGDTSSDTSGGSGSAPAEITDVTLRLNFQTDASAAPFFLAQEMGYYEEVGLDVAIEPGTGSLVTAQTVGAGQDEFGYITSDAAVQAVANDADLLIVAPLQRTYPAALVYRPSQTVETVEDLPALEIFTNQNHPQPVVLEALVEAQGGDPEALTMQYTEVAAWPGLFQDVENGAVLSRPGLQNVTFKSIDDVQMTTYADLGLEFYGNTIIVNGAWAAEHPDLVQAFVDASLKGWEESIADPEAAVDALLAAKPDAGETDVLLQMLDGTTSLTAGLGDDSMTIQPIDEELFAAQLAFMEEHMGLQSAGDPSDYYTNDYLS